MTETAPNTVRAWTPDPHRVAAEAIAGEPSDSIFVQLELTDFASIGSNPIGLLRRSIAGYGKSNELPTSSNLLTTP